MTSIVKGVVAGTLALAGASLVTVAAEAMPLQPSRPVSLSGGAVVPVYDYSYGDRRPSARGYGHRRPFNGYRGLRSYGFRRPLYGVRRPFYGYGYHRF